jgi:xanthine dehydrogenase YagR molybdenum-binding subunit
MYACPNIASNVTIVRADRATPGFMRAPAETPYFFALESAMDELAVALKMDPIELRRVNDTQTEPIKGLPYTSRALMTCFDQAAEAFDWKARNPAPGTKRDGDWLVGWGCAASAYPTQMAAATARVRVFADGRALVETAGHEIGNGLYTVAAQTASEGLGIPVEKISVSLGDTDLPPAPVAGGSISTASVCTVIAQACDAIRMRLGQDGKPASDVIVAMKDRGMGALEEYAESVPHGVAKDGIQALYRGAAMPMGGARLPDRIQFAFGAQFVEVRIHSRTREIRVPRMVGAFASGRILNPRTAHSQYMGGHDLGHWLRHSRADGDRPAHVALRQRKPGRLHDPRERGRWRGSYHYGSRGRPSHQPNWREGNRRDWHSRDISGARECDLPCHRPALAGFAAAN